MVSSKRPVKEWSTSFIKLVYERKELRTRSRCPLKLSEATDDVTTICELLRNGSEPVVILDAGHFLVEDIESTRGPSYWKSNRKFYCIKSKEWAVYQREQERAGVRSKEEKMILKLDALMRYLCVFPLDLQKTENGDQHRHRRRTS